MRPLNKILHFILEQRYQNNILSEQVRMPVVEFPPIPKVPNEEIIIPREEISIPSTRIGFPKQIVKINPQELRPVLHSDIEVQISLGETEPTKIVSKVFNNNYDKLMSIPDQERHVILNDLMSKANDRLGKIPIVKPLEVQTKPSPMEIPVQKNTFTVPERYEIDIPDLPDEQKQYQPPALPQTSALSAPITSTGVEASETEPIVANVFKTELTPMAQSLLRKAKQDTKKIATGTEEPKEDEEDYDVDFSSEKSRQEYQTPKFDQSGSRNKVEADLERARTLGKYASTYRIK